MTRTLASYEVDERREAKARRTQSEKLAKTLPLLFFFSGWNKVDRTFEEVEAPTHHWINKNGMLCVSTEHGDCAAEYYGGYINSRLEDWATENNGHWEWINPDGIVFVEN